MFRTVLKNLIHNKTAMSGLAVVMLVVLVGAFAGTIAPHDPYKVDLGIKLMNPSAEYPLGTDQLGRCILSRLIYGTRTSLYTAMIVTLVILAVGVPFGIIAGYAGGAVDNLIMRLADIVSTFPSSLLALAIVGIFGPSLHNLMLVFIFLWWAPFARMVRSSVIKLKETEFVMAAEAAGSSRISIITKHILPNTLSSIIVYATLRIAAVIVHVAGFSFIGLGSQPPTADWGVMLNDGRQYISSHPLLLVWPGLMIVITVLAFNLFGEGLNDALTPGSQDNAAVGEPGGANV